jgi:8-oxo-dGTP pyrophosphatase MutT (NUDIX family)
MKNMLTNNQIKNKLPGINHFIGMEDFFRSSILVTFYRKDEEIYFVFQKRASGIRQGGEVSFPGGGRSKSDKNGIDTAIRETIEEIGISEDKIDFIGEVGMIFAPVGSIAEVYCAELKINSLDDLNWNNEEVDYCFEVPLSYFESTKPDVYEIVMKMHPYEINNGEKTVLLPSDQLDIPHKYREPYGNARSKVLFYSYNCETIWGLTAKIVHTFVKAIAHI